ncbi:MAG TPA: NADP-dependent malic enzyme, partial [Rhizomicrobium sp.]|nr:NADP-dependent malic enzyme [Rhizomicrobium sp.]
MKGESGPRDSLWITKDGRFMARPSFTQEEVLAFHAGGKPGKIEIRPTKPMATQRDLSLAYSPGVAVPVRAIAERPDAVFDYTARGNLVAVISNGTAILGLGDLGALASKPVMEGKAVLFKRFADVDAIDLEVDANDVDAFVNCVRYLSPSFGGINLEDIKAPECFYIEEECRRTMKIPVFHDDQHGTAIISGAALLNALELVGKRIDQVRVVFNGAGASGISCARHYLNLGVRRENIVMCDTKGVIYKGRKEGMNPYKERFAAETEARTLADAFVNADVFFGLSSANCVTREMLLAMARDPIIFALANPDPEVPYDVAVATRPDAIVATGRSDFPNQVNNVLGFPFIFRGALDVRATTVNDEMQLAATRALAALAREDVPDAVRRAYGVERLEFGRDYIIPKPFDSRVLIWEAAAVAQAAMETGVAQSPIDILEYREQLERRLGKANEVMRVMIHKAQRQPKRVVFPEGEEPKILRACQILTDEKIATPVLLGDEAKIRAEIALLRLNLNGIRIVDPARSDRLPAYAEEMYSLRQRKGVTRKEAGELILNRTVFGSMMVRLGDADALVGGLTQHYPDTIRPALQVIEVRHGMRRVSGVYVMITPKREIFFLADATVNIEPTAEDLAEIAVNTAAMARRFDVEPRVAMLSFSNFGSSRHPLAEKVRRAVELVRLREPALMVDGEMQADTAVVPEIVDETFPFSTLKGGANVLIFPNLEAGN